MPLIHCLPRVGRVWCALTKDLVCPLQEGRVWCALPKGLVCPLQRGGSGVPFLRVWCALSRGEGLVCPLQEGRVWCAWCALPKGLVCPLQEGRVWCASPGGDGSGVPSPGRSGVPSPGESLVCLPWRVCPLQEGSRSGVRTFSRRGAGLVYPPIQTFILIIIIVILCSSCVMEIADLTVLRVLYWRPSPKS